MYLSAILSPFYVPECNDYVPECNDYVPECKSKQSKQLLKN
jgi:putative component of membrane protein insertase Oxa1/YidC/SpoIIIJ protein YidD